MEFLTFDPWGVHNQALLYRFRKYLIPGQTPHVLLDLLLHAGLVGVVQHLEQFLLALVDLFLVLVEVGVLIVAAVVAFEPVGVSCDAVV